MSKNIKIFLAVICLSFPIWWSVNILQDTFEDFLVKSNLEKSPPLMIADIAKSYRLGKDDFKNMAIEATAGIVIEVDKQGNERILFEKAIGNKMPIASLAKLMTAVVADEFYQPFSNIEISQEAVAQEEATGFLRAGETLQVRDLLYITLIESSNDAAFALTEAMGQEGFVALMNLKAKELSMSNTYFSNPMGLDPEDTNNGNSLPNVSTLRDLSKLAQHLLEKPHLLEILSKKEYDLYLADGTLHHTLESTNELLGEIDREIFGKTGFTEEAGGCLIVISKGTLPETYLISGLLGSPDRFAEMKKLLSPYAANTSN